MARPTKQEREKARIAALLAEGKDANGDPIQDGEIISETKNNAPNNGLPSIDELKSELDQGSFSNTQPSDNKSSAGSGLENSDFSKPDENDPDYIPQNGHNRFRDAMIENESDANRVASGQPTRTSPSGQPIPNAQRTFEEPVISDAIASNEEKTPDKKEKPVNPDFEKLSPTEKREQVEMFADSILTTYAQLLPLIPTMICSYNMGKMEILDKNGELRLSMAIHRGEGAELTVREVFNSFNKEVESTFVVTEAMKLELRDPLIAVLMEKGIAPTPMTSLLIGIGRHILMFAVATYKMLQMKSDQLEQFKEFRKEELEYEKTKHRETQHSGKKQDVKSPTVKSEPTVVSMEEAIQSEDGPSNNRPPNDSNKDTSQKGITIEDVVSED